MKNHIKKLTLTLSICLLHFCLKADNIQEAKQKINFVIESGDANQLSLLERFLFYNAEKYSALDSALSSDAVLGSEEGFANTSAFDDAIDTSEVPALTAKSEATIEAMHEAGPARAAVDAIEQATDEIIFTTGIIWDDAGDDARKIYNELYHYLLENPNAKRMLININMQQ